MQHFTVTFPDGTETTLHGKRPVTHAVIGLNNGRTGWIVYRASIRRDLAEKYLAGENPAAVAGAQMRVVEVEQA